MKEQEDDYKKQAIHLGLHVFFSSDPRPKVTRTNNKPETSVGNGAIAEDELLRCKR